MKILIEKKLAVAFPGDEYLEDGTYKKRHVPVGWFVPVYFSNDIPKGWFAFKCITNSESKATVQAYHYAKEAGIPF